MWLEAKLKLRKNKASLKFSGDVGDKKIDVIKVVRTITGLGLKEAKAIVDGAPSSVKEGANKEEADTAKSQLEEAGATVELK